MSENIELCSYCKLPKKATTASASMTQWLTTCYCDLKSASPAPQIQIYICETCGKRINEQKKGSLTQFIFKSDSCQCDRPSNLGKIIERPTNDPAIPYEELEEHTEGELDLSSNDFPTDRYKPIEVIGKGAVGVVYKARDKLLNKLVAVKTLQSLTSDILMEFQNEAKATSKFNHPCIVQVLDFGKTDTDIPYLVLEYLQGSSLDKILESGPLAWQNAQVIFQEVCMAMSYAHENGIYHRDIKPSNIIINIDSNNHISVKVIDFGIAKIVSQLSESKEKLNQPIVGTPNYMSPDQGLGLKFDSRSEIYSFGCVMFETITGKLPIQGSTPLQTLNFHANKKPSTLAEATSNPYPEELEEIIATCLSKNASERYQSFNKLNSAISSIIFSNTDYRVDKADPVEPKQLTVKKPIVFISLGLSILFAVGIVNYFIKSTKVAETTESLPKPVELEFNDKTALELAMDNTTFKGEWSFQKNKNGSIKATGMAISDKDFEELKNIKNLQALKIKTTDQLQGTGFEKIMNQPLVNLEINSSILDDSGLALISKFKTLKSLNIKFADNITTEGFDAISNLKKLKLLQLWQLKLPPEACKTIAKLKNLKQVTFGHATNFTADDLALLTNLPKLKELQIVGNTIDNSFIPAISDFGHLKILLLEDTKITLPEIKKLLKHNHYKSIRLSLNDEITMSEIVKLKRKYPKTRFRTKDAFNRFIKL